MYLLVKFFPEGPSSPSYIYISSKSLDLFAWIFFTLLFVCRDGSNSKYVRPGSLEDSLSNVSLGMIPTHPTLTNIDTHSIHHKIFGNEEQVQEIQRQKKAHQLLLDGFGYYGESPPLFTDKILIKKEYTKKVVLNKVFGPKVPKKLDPKGLKIGKHGLQMEQRTLCFVSKKHIFFVKRRKRKGNGLYLTGSLMLLK